MEEREGGGVVSVSDMSSISGGFVLTMWHPGLRARKM